MRRTTIAIALAAFCMLGTLAQAAPFHYNVDQQTLPGGPMELVNLDPPDFNGTLDQYTFHFGAKNNGTAAQLDVLFLLQFVYDPAIALAFNDAPNDWTGAGNTLSFPGLSEYSLTDTDAPLLWTKTSPTRNGTLLLTDDIPFVQLGDIAGLTTLPFDLVVQVNTGFSSFSVVGTFVALPEPSSVVLLGIGIVGMLAVHVRRARR